MMAYRYHVDARTSTIFGEGAGVITLEDVLTARNRLSKVPAFDSAFALLIDLPSAERLDLDGSRIARIAEVGPLSKSSPRAIVVPNAGSFGCARMYQTYSEFAGVDLVEVFRDRIEAVTWIQRVMLKPETQPCDSTPSSSLDR
jgi:hypothetical protein